MADQIMHVHYSIDGTEILQKLNHIIKHQHEMATALEDLKAKLAASDEKITILTTATEGVTADVAFIKAKLEANTGGIDAAGVAELTSVVDAQSQKLSEAASKLQALDQETDSTTPPAPQA